mmetsp:Transcript_3435/g.6022  ORF Transcript_3435/g.6022 Transcript_3435/m.6022 type:complete len:81 (-) Transcript_3435:30-272(-)
MFSFSDSLFVLNDGKTVRTRLKCTSKLESLVDCEQSLIKIDINKKYQRDQINLTEYSLLFAWVIFLSRFHCSDFFKHEKL